MNVVFIGGGSLRIAPIVRGMLNRGGILEDGSVRLVDLKLDRAEAVGNAIKSCPEIKDVNCEVMVTDNLDLALDGADALYITMAIEREPSLYQAQEASVRHGYLCSDQLSVNGAFLAARGGPPIMMFARKMEKYCPDAAMLIFANPVPVYSAMINNYTKVKALGICAGYTNHCWDLPRFCGKDEFDESMNVVSAGVNHMAFILRGIWQDRDLFDIMREHFTEDWQQPKVKIGNEKAIHEALRRMGELLTRYDTTIFSTEGDGIDHLFPEAGLEKQRRQFVKLSPEELKQHTAKAAAEIDKKFAEFAAEPQRNNPGLWDGNVNDNQLFGINENDLGIPILAAIAGQGAFQIAASAPNNGAVDGFSDRASLEYTMIIDGKNITPVENQYIPAPFHGVISGMSEFQTLQADAIAQSSARLFADALEAYPLNQFTSNRREYYREMFGIYSDIRECFRDAVKYF